MKMFKKLYTPLLLFVFSLLIACGDDDGNGDNEIVLPSNLSVTVTEDLNIQGLVNVVATAEKTNFYTFIFSDQTGTTVKESTNGEESYQYTDTGSYSITVRAHVTTDRFIETSETIHVTFGLQPPPTAGSGPPDSGYTTPLSYPNLALVWNDEFDGTSLNTSDWNFEIGTGNNGWGNNELQHYRQENTSVANGYLTIEAKDEFFGTSNYTSSRLTTENKRSFQYGRIDIRAAMPFGQGIWPALWMLGDNFRTAGWPHCGEIDIMEMVGGITTGNRGDGITHGTAHWADANGNRAQFGNSRSLSNGILADEFHVYSIIWNSQKIEWYIDDQRYHSLDIATDPTLSEFHQKFFFIFNVAVGGDWPGSPNSTTTFPQRMYVDYVRVFQ